MVRPAKVKYLVVKPGYVVASFRQVEYLGSRRERRKREEGVGKRDTEREREREREKVNERTQAAGGEVEH